MMSYSHKGTTETSNMRTYWPCKHGPAAHTQWLRSAYPYTTPTDLVHPLLIRIRSMKTIEDGYRGYIKASPSRKIR